MNIKMTYLYRDGGNYKHWFEVVFPNRNGISVEQLTKDIKQRLISGEYFEQSQAPMPFDYPDLLDPDLDHTWLEFHGLDEADMNAEVDQDIRDFIASL
ncbi:MAG: hypothetical protein U1F27_08280 [Turneriella sp.]